MPCSLEHNCRSGVALATRHRHSGSPPTGSGLGEGDEHPPMLCCGAWSILPLPLLPVLPIVTILHKQPAALVEV